MMGCHALVRRRWTSAKHSTTFQTVACHLAGFSSEGSCTDWGIAACLGFSEHAWFILGTQASTCLYGCVVNVDFRSPL